MNQNAKINYIEIPAKNIEAAKDFFSSVFDWSFTDYGPEYTAFSNAGIDGGFFKFLKCSTIRQEIRMHLHPIFPRIVDRYEIIHICSDDQKGLSNDGCAAVVIDNVPLTLAVGKTDIAALRLNIE